MTNYVHKHGLHVQSCLQTLQTHPVLEARQPRDRTRVVRVHNAVDDLDHILEPRRARLDVNQALHEMSGVSGQP